MGIIIGVVVLALIVGGVVFAMKAKGAPEEPTSSAGAVARATTPASGPAPSAPGQRPSDSTKPPLAPPIPASATSLPGYSKDPVPFTKPSSSLPKLGLEPSAERAAPPAAAEQSDDHEQPDDHEEHEEHEVGFDRFGAPGQRAKTTSDDLLSKPLWEVAGGATAESDGSEDAEASEPEVAEEPEDAQQVEPAAEASETEVAEEPEDAQQVEPAAEAEPEVAEPEVAAPEDDEVAPAPEPETVAESSDDTVIVVDTEEVKASADQVDHVLNALINRAKERQVGIAEVAAELVEQADLEDKEVDEVLADLLGVSEGSATDDPDRPELTLFSAEVPQRPGQLTDFARLGRGEKKRALIRVLCLLVAMQEEQRNEHPDDELVEGEAEGTEDVEAGGRNWPLARGAWPVKTPQRRDEEQDLPGRSSLAKTR